ncbi:L,D-transpeptidase family protein [Microbacterium sp. P07]|uniref:L,D-transpeptidase family protein n=1 Tax=Microbacterium sp. P07 TaxID=3366952 RepID=UPI0037451A86
MTDLVTRPDADADGHDDKTLHASAAEGSDGGTPHTPLAWAPSEPARPKKKRTALWIGLPVGATLTALVAASFVLIAPGASVAGVQVGGLTAGVAADAIAARLADTTVVLNSSDGTFEVTGADLGANVDARALADAAFAENPMWNPSTWYPGTSDAAVTIDPSTATTALQSAAPDLYDDPTNASIAFDAGSASFAVTPAVPGEGVDLAAVQTALQQAFDSGQTTTTIDVTAVPVEALATTDEANATAGTLNGILDSVGFYVGDERTVPVDRAVAASWFTVTAEGGDFAFTADPALIQPSVDGVSAAVNRDAVNATVVTDSSGGVLLEQVKGVTGRAIESTDGIAAAFATQLGEGNGAFALSVAETPFQTAATERRIEVNLSTQMTYLYENDQVIHAWASSTGLPGSATTPGNFRIGWKNPLQDMGCFPGAPYCTENVPWVAYFNGDQGFHGAYWHNNFGNVMSHGCVNLPVASAKFLYDWAPKGTEVWVHS